MQRPISAAVSKTSRARSANTGKTGRALLLRTELSSETRGALRRNVLREGRDQPGNAHDGDDALEVVGERGERELGTDLGEALHQKVGLIHPPLDGAEGVFDDRLPLAEDLRVCSNSRVHLFEHVLVGRAGDPTRLAVARALWSQCTTAACVGPVIANVAPLLV